MLGLTCVWSIVRRAGGETPATGTVPPVFEQPFEAGGGGFVAAVTTAVGTDVAELVPVESLAATRTRMVLPASTALRR